MTRHDDDTARLLRETLHERADLLVGAHLAVPGTRPRRRPAVPLIAVAAAAVVAALTVGGVAAWRDARPEPPAAAANPSPVPSASPSVPAGWKPVASLGMEVHVPATWRLTGEVSEECGLLTFDTRVVSRPVGVVPAIGCDGIRQGTLVSFVPERPGQKAGREDLGNNITQFTWLSPSGGAVVASGPDVAVLQQVIATARTVAVDSLGCPTTPTRPTWDRPRDGLPPVRLGADVTDVVACVYQGYPFGDAYRTVASARFDAAGRDALAVALRRAPADTTPDPRKTCATVFPGEIFAVLNVRTAAGVIPMTLHWTGCANRYVATAEAQSATTERLLDTVMDAVGIGVGYSALPEG